MRKRRSKGNFKSGKCASFIERANDPLTDTVLDYVYNLAASGALNANHVECYDNKRSLVRRLIDRDATPAEKRLLEDEEDLDEGAAAALDSLVERRRRRKRKPADPGEPVCSNLRSITSELGFGEDEAQVLQFALACLRSDMKVTLDPLPCEGTRSPAILTAAALGLSVDAVEAALDPKGRLVTSGLVTIAPNGDLDDRIEADQRLERLAYMPGLDKAKFVEQFLPTAPPPSLASADFGHLAAEVATAQRLLAAALDTHKAGVNILFHGPTGTGKSELARLLASELRVPLLLAGREDSAGESPDARERLTSLLLGNRLLRHGRSLLLFDEMEDLFERNFFADLFGGGGQDRRLMSKQWFNLLLENNPVPTIWISNRVSGMDRAFLRRFSFVVELGDFTAMQRRRAWVKHLGGEEILPCHDVDLLAQRFDISPAHIETAVTAARLVSGGKPDRTTLESILKPAERLLHGLKAPPPVFHAERYLPELVNTPADLDAVEKRVVAWRAGDGPGLSLCLFGPPGTGKSELVRYLAHRAGRPLCVRRASDLLSKWVGESEKLIARAFEEARRDEAFLLFDEADSFLQDRRGAHHSWEVTQVNEFLQQLEVFPGLVACTTNLMETLDQASLRRFVFKIPFKYLRPEQAVLAFRRALLELGGGEELPAAVATELGRIPNLAPGDFAACERRMRGMDGRPRAEDLLAEVEAEVRVKEKATGRVGF